MAEGQPHHRTTLVVRDNQGLIGIPAEEEGQPVTRYFVDEEAADAASSPSTLQQALSVIGAWEEIDTPDALDRLDRIRHESTPTPPIDDV